MSVTIVVLPIAHLGSRAYGARTTPRHPLVILGATNTIITIEPHPPLGTPFRKSPADLDAVFTFTV